MYSHLPPLHFSSCSFWGYSTAAQFLPTRGSSPGATRSKRTSRRSSPSRRPCGALLPRVIVYVLRFRILCIRHLVINVINNIRIRFIYIFFVICAVIYCSFCCIYVWLDPGTYMIARFMSSYKPGVTICTNWEFLGLNIKPSTSCHCPLLLANGSYALALGRDTKPGHHGLVHPDSRRQNLIFCTIRNFIHALK